MKSKNNKITVRVSDTKVRDACEKLGEAVKDRKNNGGTKAEIKLKALELISILCKDVEA